MTDAPQVEFDPGPEWRETDEMTWAHAPVALRLDEVGGGFRYWVRKGTE